MTLDYYQGSSKKGHPQKNLNLNVASVSLSSSHIALHVFLKLAHLLPSAAAWIHLVEHCSGRLQKFYLFNRSSAGLYKPIKMTR